MKTNKRLVALLLAFTMLFGAAAGTLVSCGGDECTSHIDNDRNGVCDNEGCGASVPVTPTTKVQYTVSVNTIGGMPLKDATVSIMKGDGEYVSWRDTDANGLAAIQLLPSDDYYITLSHVPDGYNVAEKYYFDGRSCNIVLSSSIVENDTNAVPSTYKVGDIFHDLTLTLDNGTTVKLSELVGTGANQKKALVLNFWYTTCSWCIEEFPILDALAEEYEDSVATLALNTYGENMSAVKSFKSSNGLTLDMAVAPTSLFAAFGTGGYPTTVVIDRYGTICLVVPGAITSETQFEKLFTYFTADNYKQELFETVDEFFPKAKPENVETPSTDDIANSIFADGNAKVEDAVVEFYPETESLDAEYSWPFILDEDGNLVPSNSGVESSFSTIHAELELSRGDVLGFDYWLSTEAGSDVFYVLVNGVVIYSVSGDSTLDTDATDGWKKCYPIVAEKTGTYTLTFIYNKDLDVNYGEDTVRINNLRVVEVDDIDVETYLINDAATDPQDFGGYGSYVAIVYNENDKYFHVCIEHSDAASHVCDKNGPLLLANLMGVAMPNTDSDNSIYSWAYNGELLHNGVNLYDAIVRYCSYASNGTLGTLSPVTLELADLLEKTFEIKGFSMDAEADEWLQFCKYFRPYGTDTQYPDPIKGLATFSAYETILSDGSETEEFPNHVTYDRVIMPRGLWFAFTPTQSGAYRITSNSKTGEVDGWIFTGDREELYVYDHVERFDYVYYDYSENGVEYYNDYTTNVSMVLYLEAGETYYIDIAYYDVYEVGTIDFKVEFMGADYKIFRAVSPGPFTYDLDTNNIIAGGLKVALHTDGYYYVQDKNGNPDLTKPVYADFTFATNIFGQPIFVDDSTVALGKVKRDLISLGAFDFTKTEVDREAITHLIDYAALALCEFAELSDAKLAEIQGADVNALKTLRAAVKSLIDGSDLVAMKSFIENSSFDVIVAFLKANIDGAGNGKSALSATLARYDEKLKAYSTALNNYDEDDSAANKSILDSATAALEAVEAEIQTYVTSTLLTSDTLIRSFFDIAKYHNATSYVNSYTISKLAEAYLKTDSADADKYPDMLPAALCDWIEDWVDGELRASYDTIEEYHAFLEVYKIADIKNHVFHGDAGATDKTDRILWYVENRLIDDDTAGEELYAYGCVRVDAELAGILGQLMNYYTFENVENSWVKLCYYWQTFEAPEA